MVAQRRYRYAGGYAPVSYSEGGNHYTVGSDYLGTPKVMMDLSGNSVGAQVMSPYGESQVHEDLDRDGNQVALNLRFPGQYYDQESGLYYSMFRYYDPSLGRYVQSDPIGLKGGLNTYAYVGGNPISFVDPFGLQTALINNGYTTTLTNLNNPFGHSAVALTGQGIYSPGNDTPPNSSLTDYLLREAPKRDTSVYIFDTTPEQEKRIKEYLDSVKNKPLEMWPDNCAARASNALEAGGMPNINTGFPDDLRIQMLLLYNQTVINIPQNSTSIPESLNSFNP
ncbi:hypothetical protein Maes01_00808 [Microbulbifer aestuariivivens]|uniref:RHS repeat-associated core domain-containing protein n=2 Tax=Microbulbifer aestuariivivens TaxID=1908308 RepID=A0ABP9WM21_9GAMM